MPLQKKNYQGFTPVIFLVIAVIVLLALGVFFVLPRFKPGSSGPGQGGKKGPVSSTKIDYTKEYPSSSANVKGFEQKKEGSSFTIYYHPASEKNANKSLAVLEEAGVPLYQKYIGLAGNKISVYLSTDLDEYVRVAEFPGGKENVQVGDGSAPNGQIFLYKPFEDNSGKAEGMIVHEGVHAEIYHLLGQTGIRYLPGFLNEGLAHFTEYVVKSGPSFDPLKEIYHSDLLVKGVKTGNPKILSLDELGQMCEGYIPDENLNFLCRGQGTYTVWYIVQNYNDDFWKKYLQDLEGTKSWQKSLENLTNKNTNALGQEILDKLTSSVR